VTVDVELPSQVLNRINQTLEEREKLAGTEVPYTRVSEPQLRYELKISYDFPSGEAFVSDEKLIALNRRGEPKASRSPFLERDHKARRFVVRIERQSHPRYYDVNRNRTLVSEISDPVYHPHIVAFKEEVRSWRSYYVEPSQVRREVSVSRADDPGRHGQDLAAFYWKLKHEYPREFRNVCLNLSQLVPSLRGIDVREVRGTLVPVVIEKNGAEFPFRLASEGTLRLLCLLGIAIAPNPPSVVAYEEPENGVEPSRLDILARVLTNVASKGRTQVIVTTHSQTFLDRARENASFVACRRLSDGSSVFEPYQNADKVFASNDLAPASWIADRSARGDL
jgi:predicted ATPase